MAAMATQKRLRLFMSPLLSVGLFFLINPTLSLFDPLPDFIGYLLMYAAVYELAALDERIALASKKLLILAGVSAMRLLAAIITLGYDSSTIMTLCFVFAICETILLVLFMGDWFGGFDYMLQRYGAFEALKAQTDTRFLSGVFFITRIVLGFLPEICAIFELRAHFDIDNSPVWSALAGYKSYAVLLFGLIVLLLGIYWYTVTLRYFKTVRKDSAFIEEAGARYEAFISDGNHGALSVDRVSELCITLGFVFVCDFTINMVPVLPTFASTLLLAAACLLIAGAHTDKKKLYVLTGLAAVSQAAFEYFAAAAVNPNALMHEVAVSTTVTLCVLALPYAVFSVMFMLTAQGSLAAARHEKEGLSPASGWRKLNIAYYVFIGSRIIGFVLPPVAGIMLWFRLCSQLTFIIGCILCWRRAVKPEF